MKFRHILLFLLLLLSTYSVKSQNWEQVVKTCASDRVTDSYYGYTVSIDGDYAIVGAHGEDFDANGQSRKINAGAAYILHYNGTTWVEVQKIVASDRATFDYFGCSVAISGDYVMVGANMEEDDASIALNRFNLGSVYVFHNNAGVWTETQKINAADRMRDDYFGSAVSISGDVAIIGDYLQDYNVFGLDSIGNAGAAYIYVNIAGTWTQTQKLVLPDRSETDYFGYDVDIDGDYAIIGAYAEDEDASGTDPQLEAGSSYIFKNNSGTWTLEQKIVASDRAPEDYFGYSVSISGNYAIVGAYNEDEDELGMETIIGAGSVYMFENSAGVWSQVNKVVSSERHQDDRFGYSVAISGDYAVVGAVFEDEDALDLNHLAFSGSAYVLKNTAGVWQQSRKIVPLDRREQDYFGISVAISDTMLITGAIQQDYDSTGYGTVQTEAGAAYIFKLALRDINVRQDETLIANESTFDLQPVTAGTSSGPIVFTIENEGVSNLQLIGDPKLTISGVDASYFDVDFAMLPSTIDPFGSSYFTVTFNPDEARDYYIQISIASNDENENPFYFIIRAVGGKIPQNIYNFAPIAEKTYGDNPFDISAMASSGLNVVFTSSDPDVAVCSGIHGSTIIITGAGTCDIFANQSGDDLFAAAPEISQQLVVNPKQITVSAESKTKIYGDPDPELTYTYVPELISGDNFSGTLTREPGENAGEYYEILQGTLSAGDNYTINYISEYLNIIPKTIVVTANSGQSKIYGNANPTVYTYSISSGELVGPDSFTGALTRVIGEDAGFYEILQGTLSLGANYNLVYQENYFEIIARDITVTADAGQSKEYGMEDMPFTYTFSEFPISGNSFTGALSRISGEDIGLYEITLGTLSLGNNYSISFVSDNFEITPREVNIVVYQNQYKSYGQSDPVFTYWIIGSIISGDMLTGLLGRESGESLGFYEINLGTLSAGANYSLSITPADFEIRTMMIVAIADPGQSKIYGNPNPSPYTFSYYGTLAPGDNFSGNLSRVPGENIGEYQITQGTLSLNSNYQLSFISDDFEITKRDVVVTANSGQTKIYGTTNPTVYTYSITSGNLVGTDSFYGSIKRYLGENVGEYTIHQGTLTLSQNYNLIYVANVFTITPASLTIIADAGLSKTYGDLDPIFTYTTSSPLISGDSFSGHLSREIGENSGTYEISQGTLSLGPNYNTSFIPNDFNILTKNLVVNVTDGQYKIYGDEDPILNFTTNSPIASWDNFTGQLVRESGEATGLYEISQGTLALNSNYNLSFVGSDFEIVARLITVTADANQSKTYGETDPNEYLYSYSGTLIGEDNFTGALTRQIGEVVGLYEIQLGDLMLPSSYIIEFIPSDFEIQKATPIITWETPADIYNNEALSATQLNATANIAGTFSYNPDFGTFMTVGNNQPLAVEFLPTDNINYNESSATVYINVLLYVGLEEPQESEISIYPNPTTGIVYLDFTEIEVKNIRVTDISGKLIFEKSVVLPNETLDLSMNPAGVYFVTIQTNDKVFTNRIVLQ